jgi:hypothetical protein
MRLFGLSLFVYAALALQPSFERASGGTFVVPNLVLLSALLWCFAPRWSYPPSDVLTIEGTQFGSIPVAAIAGLAEDLTSPGPLGLRLAAYATAAWMTWEIDRALGVRRPWAAGLLVGLAAAVAAVLTTAAGVLLGQWPIHPADDFLRVAGSGGATGLGAMLILWGRWRIRARPRLRWA